MSYVAAQHLYQIKLGTKSMRSLRPLWLGQGRGFHRVGGGGYTASLRDGGAMVQNVADHSGGQAEAGAPHPLPRIPPPSHPPTHSPQGHAQRAPGDPTDPLQPRGGGRPSRRGVRRLHATAATAPALGRAQNTKHPSPLRPSDRVLLKGVGGGGWGGEGGGWRLGWGGGGGSGTQKSRTDMPLASGRPTISQ